MVVVFADASLEELALKLAANSAEFAALLEQLQNATEVFTVQFGEIKSKKGEVDGEFSYTGDRDNFLLNITRKPINFTTAQSLAHEFQHGKDYLEGNIAFLKLGDTWNTFLLDVNDEVRAFQAALAVSTPLEKAGLVRGRVGDMSRYSHTSDLAKVVGRIPGYRKLPDKDQRINPNHYLMAAHRLKTPRP